MELLHSSTFKGIIFNVTKTAISNWENGIRNPDNENLIKNVKFFDVSVDYLLGVTDIRNIFTEPCTSILDNYEIKLTEKEMQQIETAANEVANNFFYNAYKINIPIKSNTEEDIKADILKLFIGIRKK